MKKLLLLLLLIPAFAHAQLTTSQDSTIGAPSGGNPTSTVVASTKTMYGYNIAYVRRQGAVGLTNIYDALVNHKYLRDFYLRKADSALYQTYSGLFPRTDARYYTQTQSNGLYWKLTGGNSASGNQALSSGNFTTANGMFATNNTGTGRIGNFFGTKIYDQGTGSGTNYVDVYNSGNVDIKSGSYLDLTATNGVRFNSTAVHLANSSTYASGNDNAGLSYAGLGVYNFTDDKFATMTKDGYTVANGAGTIRGTLKRTGLEFTNGGAGMLLINPPTTGASNVTATFQNATGTVALVDNPTTISAPNFNATGAPTTPTTGINIGHLSNILAWVNSNGRTTSLASPYPATTRQYRLPYLNTSVIASALLDSASADTKYLAKTDTTAMLNNVVHKALNETITGQKTFNSQILFGANATYSVGDATNNASSVNSRALISNGGLTIGTSGVSSMSFITSNTTRGTVTAGGMLNWAGTIQANALVVTGMATGTAGTDSVVVKVAATNALRKIPATYYAPTASPTFTGTPAAPTATAGTNTTQLATTAFVQAAIPDKFLRLTGSGTGAATTISIAHGQTGVTSASIAVVTPTNSASAGISYVTCDATNINFVYTVAPASGTNNLSYNIFLKP